MINLLNFLSKQRLLNIVICFAFYLLVTLPHEFVGVTVSAVFKGVSRNRYDLTILIIGVAILTIFGIALYQQLKKLEHIKTPLAFFTLCLALMTISLNLLIIVNIEIIHFIQYALLAILIFPLIRNFLSTLSIVTLLGAIDEAYQYYYLSPERTNYYDFNDVILNLLGAAMGLVFLRCHVGINYFLKTEIKSIHSKVWLTYFATVLMATILIWQKRFVQNCLDGIGLAFDWEGFGSVLIRIPTTGFWTDIPPKITYHVVQPFEGIVIVSLLLFTFGYLYHKAE